VNMLGRFQIDLVDGNVPPPVPVPVAAAMPSTNEFVFDTHVGTKNLGSAFTTGAQIQIDGVIADDLGSSISNEISLIVTAPTLSAGITWIVEAGSPQRTTGVNVDLFDSANLLVASDTFMGLMSGQAFSQFSTSLTPGNYHLLFTGIAPLGARYRIDLGTDATAPGFTPIVDTPPLHGVPEPASLLLIVVGLMGMAASRQSRREYRWCRAI
jgi:PEP-CTERM motif